MGATHDDRVFRRTRRPRHPRRPAEASAWRSPSGRETFWGYVFISPWLIGLAVHPRSDDRRLRPVADGPPPPTGGDQVRRDRQLHPDGSDPTVAKAIQVTFIFAAIAIPLTMLSSLTFAALLNSRRLFGKSFFRTLFYMPVQIPLVASTLVWIGF